jgi:hypothetical protein
MSLFFQTAQFYLHGLVMMMMMMMMIVVVVMGGGFDDEKKKLSGAHSRICGFFDLCVLLAVAFFSFLGVCVCVCVFSFCYFVCRMNVSFYKKKKKNPKGK